jgi:hypothetical protein
MPLRPAAVNPGYYNASPECWSVYTEVIGAEYGNAPLFGSAHQLSVDTYAVQHAGGPHPDKSVDVHLSGLYLVLERGAAPTSVPPLLQRLATVVKEWPHFPPPIVTGCLTVLDVALAEDHIATVRAWASGIWKAWAAHHAAVAELITSGLDRNPARGPSPKSG